MSDEIENESKESTSLLFVTTVLAAMTAKQSHWSRHETSLFYLAIHEGIQGRYTKERYVKMQQVDNYPAAISLFPKWEIECTRSLKV